MASQHTCWFSRKKSTNEHKAILSAVSVSLFKMQLGLAWIWQFYSAWRRLQLPSDITQVYISCNKRTEAK